VACRAPTRSLPSRKDENPVPTKINPLGVKGAGEAAMSAHSPPSRTASSTRPYRHARDTRKSLARDPRGASLRGTPIRGTLKSRASSCLDVLMATPGTVRSATIPAATSAEALERRRCDRLRGCE